MFAVDSVMNATANNVFSHVSIYPYYSRLVYPNSNYFSAIILLLVVSFFSLERKDVQKEGNLRKKMKSDMDTIKG